MDLEEQVLSVIVKYFNNEDWQGYLDSLKNKTEVMKELNKIFKGEEKWGNINI